MTEEGNKRGREDGDEEKGMKRRRRGRRKAEGWIKAVREEMAW